MIDLCRRDLFADSPISIYNGCASQEAKPPIKEQDMSTSLWTGLILLVLGISVWLFGNRMWLLGAGAGALLGYGLLRLFPSITDGTLGLLIVIGLAVLFGVLGFMGKAFAKILAWIVGFVVGSGLALAFLSLLNVTPGILDWILALVAGAIVAGIFGRFLGWALIIFAALLGSMLMIRGVTVAFPTLLTGTIATLVVIVLTGVGIFYHYRQNKPKAEQPPAAPPPAAPAPKS
jgi:hypothetical protein